MKKALEDPRWSAKWIWDETSRKPENIWVCFRKVFDCTEPFDAAHLRITADSRYYLYVNGEFLGHGPARSWPAALSYDEYEISQRIKAGKNAIAVLVNHHGVSTSQYVLGRGGLIAQADFLRQGKTVAAIGTDSSWKTRIHRGYDTNTPRINFAQPYTEVFNAGRISSEWMQISFPDEGWQGCVELGPYGTAPWTSLVPRDIPLLARENIYPKCIKSVRGVKPAGQSVTLDFRRTMYPDDFTTDDRVQLGYICTFLKANRPIEGKIKLQSREWIQRSMEVKLNDRRLSLSPAASKTVCLEKGLNILLIDISGQWQQYCVDLHFEFPDALEFIFPWQGKDHQFAAIGPFEYQIIGNVSCADRAAIDWENKSYKEFFTIDTDAQLRKYSQWIKPLGPNGVIHNGIKNLYLEKTQIKQYSLPAETGNMLTANDNPTVIWPGDGIDLEYTIDFGQEVSGYIEFELEADRDVIFDFLFFEYLDHGRPEIPQDLDNTLRYVSGGGRQKYASTVRRGFRYICMTLRNAKTPVEIFVIRLKQCTYPVVESGEFQCSDFLLNSVWEISKRTLKLCMEDTFVDCPGFEQAYWLGDARVQALCCYYVYGAKDIVKRGLKLAALSLERSKIPESHVPAGLSLIIPLWGLLWMTSCREYYVYTGDRDFILEIYPCLKKAAEMYLSYLDERGLFNITAWNQFDWAGMDTPSQGAVAHQNAAMYKALGDIAFLANLTGNAEDAHYFHEKSAELQRTINACFWDDIKQAYADSIHQDGALSDTVSIQTNMLMDLWNCASPPRKAILKKYLDAPPESFVKIGSPFASFFYFEALAQHKDIEAIVNDIRVKWGEMLEYGTTTCWETFNGFFKDRLARSYCHAWSAAPVYFLGAHVLGITPEEVGFKSILIKPCPCGFEWARGAVPTPFGPIEVSWRVADSRFHLDLYIPEGIEYEISIPEMFKNCCRIAVNGAAAVIPTP